MAGETVITVVGNLTADPELRFTPSGAAVANFTVASTPRFLDKQSGEWKDGEALFLTCNVWRQAAEHVAESLQRGTRVIVVSPAAIALSCPYRLLAQVATEVRHRTVSGPRGGSPWSAGWTR